MPSAAQQKEKQHWAVEEPKLDNARKLRGSSHIDPDDMEAQGHHTFFVVRLREEAHVDANSKDDSGIHLEIKLLESQSTVNEVTHQIKEMQVVAPAFLPQLLSFSLSRCEQYLPCMIKTPRRRISLHGMCA